MQTHAHAVTSHVMMCHAICMNSIAHMHSFPNIALHWFEWICQFWTAMSTEHYFHETAMAGNWTMPQFSVPPWGATPCQLLLCCGFIG